MTTLSAARPIEPMAVHPLRPLPVWQAIILFAVPAAAMALAAALRSISPKDAPAWFAHCGYAVSP